MECDSWAFTLLRFSFVFSIQLDLPDLSCVFVLFESWRTFSNRLLLPWAVNFHSFPWHLSRYNGDIPGEVRCMRAWLTFGCKEMHSDLWLYDFAGLVSDFLRGLVGGLRMKFSHFVLGTAKTLIVSFRSRWRIGVTSSGERIIVDKHGLLRSKRIRVLPARTLETYMDPSSQRGLGLEHGRRCACESLDTENTSDDAADWSLHWDAHWQYVPTWAKW